MTFGEMTSALGSGIFVQPIISYLELISLRKVFQMHLLEFNFPLLLKLLMKNFSSKNFAKMDSYKIDPTQEMMALGFTNFFNSFVNGAFVVSAGMSRSTVNYQANAATQELVSRSENPGSFILSLF